MHEALSLMPKQSSDGKEPRVTPKILAERLHLTAETISAPSIIPLWHSAIPEQTMSVSTPCIPRFTSVSIQPSFQGEVHSSSKGMPFARASPPASKSSREVSS